MVYRNYKIWSEEHFVLDLTRNLQSMPTVSYTNFETAFENALEANAPKRQSLYGEITNPMWTRSYEKS